MRQRNTDVLQLHPFHPRRVVDFNSKLIVERFPTLNREGLGTLQSDHDPFNGQHGQHDSHANSQYSTLNLWEIWQAAEHCGLFHFSVFIRRDQIFGLVDE